MDWFEALTGFAEAEVGYPGVQARLRVEHGLLRSTAGGRAAAVGRLELPSLAELRVRVAQVAPPPGALRVSAIAGDVRALHAAPAQRGALFQVASQFNLLEMVGPDVRPERGVTGYVHDRTQGPACALAAGAATIYRNYLVPVDGQPGQTAARQLDTLAEVGTHLGARLGLPPGRLWQMRNGYALATAEGLAAAAAWLEATAEADRDAVRAALRVGVQWDVEVTDVPPPDAPRVSQVFCSALPVAYGRHPPARWAPLAQLVLEGAYEATLLVAALNAALNVGRGAAAQVLLTRLGGGVFGNAAEWIDAAIERALAKAQAAGWGLDVRLVSFGAPCASTLGIVERARVRAT